MKKYVKKYIKILLLVVLLMLAAPSVKAASAKITASSTSAYVGDSVTINAIFTAASWNLTISGNGVSTTKYADVTSDAENATKTQSVKLDTSKAGTYTVKLTGDITDGTTGNTTNVNTSVTVTVKEKPAVAASSSGNSSASSSNSTGSNSSSTDTSSSNKSVSASKSTSTSSSSAAGTTSTSVNTTGGNSTLTDNSQTKVTEINTIETDKMEEQETEETLPFGISKLVVYGINENNEKEQIEISPVFDINIFEYTCSVGSNIKKIDIEKDANNYDEYLEIIGLGEELKTGENIIIFRMNKDDKSIEYKLIINRENEETVVEDTEETETVDKTDSIEENEKEDSSIILFLKEHGWCIGITIILMLVEAGIFVFVIKRKYKSCEW